ncbi:MAG: LysR family transcriptional regulator [Polyangiaceae bacterium]
MTNVYGRDLNLNLLRVFGVVAECGSVTEAARRLYLTQPAVSAALRRLSDALGTPLFARRGRGLSLSRRGAHLHASIQAHLPALLSAALESETFNPRSSERTFRIGLSDASELWLLPALLHHLERNAPRIKILSVPVQFRNVGLALASGQADLAVTVADELPSNIQRAALFWNDFVCLFESAPAPHPPRAETPPLPSSARRENQRGRILRQRTRDRLLQRRPARHRRRHARPHPQHPLLTDQLRPPRRHRRVELTARHRAAPRRQPNLHPPPRARPG